MAEEWNRIWGIFSNIPYQKVDNAQHSIGIINSSSLQNFIENHYINIIVINGRFLHLITRNTCILQI